MARLFPSKPVGKVSPEMAKLVLALRSIPGDETLAWISLPVSSDWCPELMVLHRERACWLITLSPLTEPEAERTVQVGLFDADTSMRAEDLGVAERGLLASFHADILRESGYSDAADLPLRKVLAFPNVPQILLDRIAELGGIEGFAFWGKERIRAEALRAQFEATTGTALPGNLVQCLRRKFSPETRIPVDMVSRASTPRGRSVVPELTDFLLDLDQEWLVKDDLRLSPEADAALRELRPRLVTGVAGSGKSLVLLYRAMLLAKLEPSARILVLTHNRPLNGELQERFARLCPGASVEWATFFQWCYRLLGKWWREPVFDDERQRMIEHLVGKGFENLQSLPLEFIRDELDWVRDQGIASVEDYLGAVRGGRKRPLSNIQRKQIHALRQTYEAELRRRGKDDWSGIAGSLVRGIQSGHIRPGPYDFIFVDEAQFFAPTWFTAVRSAVRPQSGQLFLAADPTQGFLKRRQSWLSSGLDVRGRSVRLRMSYRNTRETLEFAARFYRSRLPDEDEEINIPDAAELADLARGDAPRFLRVDSGQTEMARIASEIVAAVRAGADPSHYLVLHAEGGRVDAFVATLNRLAGRPLARKLRDLNRSGTGCVKVSALDAATGLECPVVFLCGLDAILESERALGLEPSEREERIRDNTRRIYMGATRASAQLFLTYRSQAIRDLLEASHPAPKATPSPCFA